MLAYRDALDCLMHVVAPLGRERLPLTTAAGRTLAVDLIAPHPMPPYDQSMMDGYVLRSDDTQLATPSKPVRAVLSDTVMAGETRLSAVAVGHASRIMTGAMIPFGADVVVRLEDGEVEGDVLVLRQPLRRGQYIQRRGNEIQPDTVLCRTGQLLTPQRIGMALALGLSMAEVVRTPQIALVAPGDELLPPGVPLEPGKKWCSNLYALEARAQELGGMSTNVDLIPDTLEALIGTLQKGLSDDIVVILGASGRGDHDYAGRAMSAIGAEYLFRGVSMAPGRSVAASKCGKTLILGLPGAPWASFVTFDVLVRPVLRAMLGQPAVGRVPAVLTADVRVRRGMTHFIPVRMQSVELGWSAEPLGDLFSVSQVESAQLGWLQVPPHRRQLLRGVRCWVHAFN